MVNISIIYHLYLLEWCITDVIPKTTCESVISNGR